MTLDINTALLFVLVALNVATLLQARRGGGLTRRARRRDEYAARACAYAEQMGGTPKEKLRHALEAFTKLDVADNRKRDYTEAEARLAVEAHLGMKA